MKTAAKEQLQRPRAGCSQPARLLRAPWMAVRLQFDACLLRRASFGGLGKRDTNAACMVLKALASHPHCRAWSYRQHSLSSPVPCMAVITELPADVVGPQQPDVSASMARLMQVRPVCCLQYRASPGWSVRTTLVCSLHTNLTTLA